MGSTEITSEMSRRSTRIFTEEEQVFDNSTMPAVPYSSSESSVDGSDMGGKYSRKNSTTGVEMMQTHTAIVDLGRNLDIFPSTAEDVRLHITESIQAARVSTKAKEDGRPINFGVVLPGKIYRSSWPTAEDFPYLSSLRLKTVLSLVQNDLDPEFAGFLKSNQIQHKVIDMPGTKKVDITKELMQGIMEVVLDEANFPILIHCNHGKHRTGCAVGVVRHVARWGVEAIIEEYRGYADPKIRECDVKYLIGFDVQSLQNLFATKKQDTPASSRDQNINSDIRLTERNRKMLRFLIFAAAVLMIWITSYSWACHWELA
ncbi:related to SIW14 Protein involved in actin filament organization [Rhynchosporium agropyri]|uniref:diphosphoinositol-polyphosphate diphosphatase n=1 Tax=Rhynchosporium agropyri TaxID=914238 RepID=A0A1E1LJH8_9HELO|nr:related to SIW14 Protein involved in actin filament organization [Rhynchosporium agropyri]